MFLAKKTVNLYSKVVIYSVLLIIVALLPNYICNLFWLSPKMTHDTSVLELKNHYRNMQLLNYFSVVLGFVLSLVGAYIFSKNLESSMEVLKSFVSNASHELKTPISILCSYSSALSRGQIKTDEEKKKYYDIILKQSLEMRTITDNLLAISRLDNPNLKLEKENLNIKNIIKESLEKYDFMEFEKNIDVKLSIEGFEIKADYKILKLAIDNIICNALKYSPDNSQVKIYSQDRNIFIENLTRGEQPEKIENLWKPFFRGRGAENLKIDGTGLGLSIVKKSLELNSIKFDIDWARDKFMFEIKL